MYNYTFGFYPLLLGNQALNLCTANNATSCLAKRKTCGHSIVREILFHHNCDSVFLIEKYNFLGISIVGQSNERGDGGIYIGSIMKGGAVGADGRIEPGDMLLQVRKRSPSNHSFRYLLLLVTC